MLQCLAHGSPAVTQAAVQGMCHLVSQAGMDAGQATDMLLASLASPGSEACVLALVDGIADLAQEQALQGTVACQCLGLGQALTHLSIVCRPSSGSSARARQGSLCPVQQ